MTEVAELGVFRGESEMAARMRAFDWSATPLGPVDQWSASLRTTVGIMLGTRHSMFLWWGPDLIQFYNDSYAQSLGPDRHPSALGQRGRECWAEIWPIIGHEVESIMSGGDATWHEDALVPITRGDRVYDVYWSYSYSPVADDDGSVGGLLVTVQETTRRVMSERRIRLLQELVVAMQAAGSADEVCDAAGAALGGAPDDLAYVVLSLADPGGGPERVARAVGLPPGASGPPDGSYLSDRWPEPVTERLTLPLGGGSPGAPAHGSMTAGLNPRILVDREYASFVAEVAREIGAAIERRRIIERAFAETERLATERDAERLQLLAILEQSPLAVAVAEAPSGRMRFANRKVAEIFGDARAPERLEDYSEHWHGFHLDGRPVRSEEWPMARALRDGVVVEHETLEIVRGSGRRALIALNAAPVRNDAGEVVAAIAFFRDITEERRTERQLRDAQRMQAVGTLAGGVAHEINNQMTAVVGFGEYVLRALGPEHAQSSDMRLVLQAGQRAARVSQQLLAFTRQQVAQPRMIDLPALVAELRPVLEQLLGADKMLSVMASAATSRISADPEQVQQMLINLVANARDATDTGAEIRIGIEDVRIGREMPAPLGEAVPVGRYVRLAVADSGTGMSADTLARIFDPFFTTKAVGEGTGLGLPMVYGTMRRQGGYIVARSRPGSGTTMELYWTVPAADEVPGDDARRGRGRQRSGGEGLAILVVEDEPTVRALAARALQEEGYAVSVAEDGAEALAMLESGAVRPVIIVTDITMPRLNGRQLYDAVRARWPGIGVLFISGHTGDGDVLERLLPSGAPFLQKPFAPEGLVRSVATLRSIIAPRIDAGRTGP